MKTSRWLLFAISLMSSLPTLAAPNSHYVMLEKGRKAQDAALFDEAVTCYERVLDSVADDISLNDSDATALSNETTLQMAEAHFAAGRYDKVIETLKHDAVDDKGRRLLAKSYQLEDQPNEAVSILQSIQTNGTVTQDDLWHLAHAYYEAGDIAAAEKLFQQFAIGDTSPHLQHLSQLYLARIEIDQHRYIEALKRLESLTKIIPPEDPLHYELHYWSGDASYSLQAFAEAASHYERALPRRNPEKVDWSRTSMAKMANSYLAIADATDTSEEDRVSYLKKAYDVLQHLRQTSPDDEVWLALGKYYIVSGHRLNNPTALAQAEAILTQSELFTSRQAYAQALLLRAEAAPTYRERHSLYRQLTDASQLSGNSYPLGWYLRGLNDLAEADREQDIALYDAAVHALRRAFSLLATINPELADQAAKQAIKAYLSINTDRANGDALRFVASIYADYPQVAAAAADPDELLYLQAQLTARRDPTAADAQLKALTGRYPEGRYADAALYLLATRQQQRNEIDNSLQTFELLTSRYPSSSYAGEAYYWQARCLGEGVRYQELLRKVYTDYPNTPSAVEAYYSLYTPSEYLQGGAEALTHLEKMPSLFPNSPLVIQSLLLVGLDNARTRLSPEGKVIRKRNWNKAIQAFQDAEARFNDLQDRGILLPQHFDKAVALRYRANLERASANLSIASQAEGAKRHIYLEYAIDMFNKLVAELEDNQHPLSSVVTNGEPYPPMLEEASYQLAQAYALGGDDEAAQRVLDEMLERYQTAKITRGYYLSKALNQQARIAQRAKRYEKALGLLAQSEEAAKGKVLNSEEKLDLWLQRSECYKQLGMLDNAMLELSRVINDDAISGQRIQAMYLRAGIYELQERPELAQKQLEATAKKGGPWAAKAKEKLDRDYRYD